MEPIRVLQVVTYMGRGGLETMLMNYYRRMDRERVQFDFLTHRQFRADYDAEIEALGGKIYHLPRLVPWSVSYRRALDDFFRTHPEYRIVHVHQDCLSGVILKAAKKYGVPVRLAHSHNSSQDLNLRYLIKMFYMRQIPRYATQLFACGKKAGDWMFRGAPYRVLNNAIDANNYAFDLGQRRQIRESLGIPEGTFVVGHVGRFHPQKNHTFLLDVFRELQKKTNAVLLLVGNGDLRSDMEKKAAELHIADRVIFTGVRNDVPYLMQAMDCFVFPSLYEGLPVTMIEAQASGLPCVVSNAVPMECDVTGLVTYVSLKEETSVWAECVMKQASVPRCDKVEQIICEGYDIAANSLWLQNYYLQQWERNA